MSLTRSIIFANKKTMILLKLHAKSLWHQMWVVIVHGSILLQVTFQREKQRLNCWLFVLLIQKVRCFILLFYLESLKSIPLSITYLEQVCTKKSNTNPIRLASIWTIDANKFKSEFEACQAHNVQLDKGEKVEPREALKDKAEVVAEQAAVKKDDEATAAAAAEKKKEASDAAEASTSAEPPADK